MFDYLLGCSSLFPFVPVWVKVVVVAVFVLNWR